MGKPKFYDFCVHAAPDGENTVGEMASLARHFGYSGFALTNHSDKLPKTRPLLPEADGFEVFRGIELVEENPSKLHGMIGKFRSNVDVLIVHGGSEAVNRAAVENPRVDILNHPSFDRSSGLNQVLAKAAAENGVAIGLNLRPLLHSRGSRRIRLLSDLGANLDLARKYDVSLALTSDAMSCFDLRAPREMLALAEVCGLEESEALEALSTVPERILAKNRPGPGIIREGVEVLEEEDFF
ncbi:ribonuclease P protein component 3 [Methanosarcina sp. KYL-1]|uniref:ribonuclease P protein component 3 n=1 Tax=Methanosarcina sp. KYL-1 TaxID=2602068 RepID=UPI0021012DD1|nr:ribonuclease P protein component 3 [Methanosarcina sp. KYL-1]MCQ1536410.1 ribonuclease P protein component 3 [Methanosarcina sp. KYL-1]